MYGMIQHKISKVDNCLQYLFSQQQLHSLPVVSVCVCVCVADMQHCMGCDTLFCQSKTHCSCHISQAPVPDPPEGPRQTALHTAAQLGYLSSSSIGSRNENELCSCRWWRLGFNFISTSYSRTIGSPSSQFNWEQEWKWIVFMQLVKFRIQFP